MSTSPQVVDNATEPQKILDVTNEMSAAPKVIDNATETKKMDVTKDTASTVEEEENKWTMPSTSGCVKQKMDRILNENFQRLSITKEAKASTSDNLGNESVLAGRASCEADTEGKKLDPKFQDSKFQDPKFQELGKFDQALVRSFSEVHARLPSTSAGWEPVSRAVFEVTNKRASTPPKAERMVTRSLKRNKLIEETLNLFPRKGSRYYLRKRNNPMQKSPSAEDVDAIMMRMLYEGLSKKADSVTKALTEKDQEGAAENP